MFPFEDSWTLGDFEMPSSHDTLPSSVNGLDAFEFKACHDDLACDENSFDAFSDTLTDEEVCCTPEPQSPVPYVEEVIVKQEQPPLFQQHQFYLQFQQQQQQLQIQALLQQQQQKLFAPLSSPLFAPVATVPYTGCRPTQKPTPMKGSPLPGYSYFNCKMYNEPLGSMHNYGFNDNQGTSSESMFTSLDTSHFGVNSSGAKFKSIPIDISGNLTDAQYSKIFKKYHLYLQLDSHPTMTEQDLEDIKAHGKMYFLKNVKTIVPKIGPWKFNAHISHRRSDERQYNIPGMAITCKVKEWLTDDGLWRLYHYKKGKTVSNKGKKQ